MEFIAGKITQVGKTIKDIEFGKNGVKLPETSHTVWGWIHTGNPKYTPKRRYT